MVKSVEEGDQKWQRSRFADQLRHLPTTRLHVFTACFHIRADPDLPQHALAGASLSLGGSISPQSPHIIVRHEGGTQRRGRA